MRRDLGARTVGSGASRSGATRLTFAGLLVVCLAAAALVGARASADDGQGGATGAAADGSFAEQFADPPTAARPLTYWWLPPLDAVTPEGIEGDIEAMADAGIGGVLPYRRDFAMPADPSDLNLLTAALEAARQQGIKLDLSLAETATTPAITADGGADQQELVYGSAILDGGEAFSGELPPPSTRPEQPRSLVAVVAAHCTTSCETEIPLLLDRDSLVDLTSSVQNEEVEWTAPGGPGEWILLSFWARSAPALPSSADPTADLGEYADHLSAAGAKAITDYLDEQVLTPELQTLLDEAGGVLHEDSLHLGGYHLWSRDLLSEFRQRRGYSLRKYLPVSIIAYLNEFFTPEPFGLQVHTDSPADFDFAGAAGKRIRNDYFQTLSELWEEEYLMALQRWAKQHGLGFRSQVAYGQTFSTSTAARVDVPMTESFQLGDTLDGFRSMAGAVHMGGRNLFSIECCVQVSGTTRDNYATTWKRMLATIHNSFAAGINEVTLHGVTYPEAPGATWPGFSNFDSIFSEEFGPRMPYWQHMPELMDFLGREQLVLREGKPRVDVAVYRQSYWDYGFPTFGPSRGGAECEFSAGCELLNDKTLERAGYTYEFLGPETFDLPGATVRDGRLSPDGPAYKALVLNPGQRNSVGGVPLATARQLLGYAQEGLPIVVVGEAPRGTGFFGDAAEDPEVRRTIARVLEQPSVRQVATEAEIAAALEDLDVDAAARPAQPSNLLSFRRADGEGDYYFLWNQNRVDKVTGEPDPEPEDFDQEVTFEGRGQPYALDAWTGEITPIATYERDGDRITTRVSLEPGETTIIAIGPEDWQRSELGVEPPADRHARRTTADEAVYGDDGELRIRATSPGTYTTDLSDGRSVESTIEGLPDSRALADWHLSVEDWQPGATATETLKVPHELDLDSLSIWPEIPELEDASGIGRYTTQVELGGEWTGADRGARLELGPLFDSVRLKINGQSVGYVDPDNPAVDVSSNLVPGTNEFEVEVATTLRNRVRTLFPGFANVERQPYGLVGTVRILPYGEEEIPDDGQTKLRLTAQPKVHRVGPDRTHVRYELRARNVGDAPIAQINLCARGPNRRVTIAGSRCVQRELSAGGEGRRPVGVRIRPAARGKVTRIHLLARGLNVDKRKTSVRLKVRR